MLVTERPGLHAGGVWNQTCVFCHNTVPYFDDVWGALYEQAGTRRAPGYQGEVVDKLLPPDRRFRFEVAAAARGAGRRGRRRGDGRRRNAGGRRARAPAEALKRGIHELRARFAARHFVEVGIGCEACHGGSREHADDPRVLPDFAPRSAFLEARPEVARTDGEVTRAERINRALRPLPPGAVLALPVHLGGGTAARRQPGRQLDHLGRGARLPARRLRAPDVLRDLPRSARRGSARRSRAAGHAGRQRRLRPLPRAVRGARGAGAHAHHDPNGAGASCVGCHMPRKNMGLGYALTRYHRIGLPDDPVRVERDRPLECALCHADKTVGELVATMERWWGRKYDRAALAALYGGLDARPLEATLARGKAHEQAVALATLGAAHVTAAAPAVARQLVNPFPLVRYYARRALEALRGQDCAVDLDRPTPEIAAAVRACVPEAFAAGPPSPTGAAPARGGNDVDED